MSSQRVSSVCPSRLTASGVPGWLVYLPCLLGVACLFALISASKAYGQEGAEEAVVGPVTSTDVPAPATGADVAEPEASVESEPIPEPEPGVEPEPSLGPEPSAAPATVAPASGGPLKFSFRHAPWEEVLEWLAGQADLSFSPDVVPTGTFNYIDEKRSFTTEEAIDLVNSYLLIKGYTVVRKGKMLLVIDLEDEVDAQLVRDLLTETPLSELDKRGEYEITKTRFTVDKIDAAEVEKQINQLLSPVGSIVVMPKAKQILITETGGTLRTMRGILQSLETTAAAEESSKLHTYQLTVASADEVLAVARPLLGIQAEGNAADDGSIRISADPLGRTVFATGTPEKIKLVEQIVKSVDSRAGSTGADGVVETPQFMLHPVSTTSSDAVLRVVQTLFVGDPVIRVEVDRSTGGILAYAKASQHRSIKATIAEMEQNPERVEVLPLTNTDPTVAALLIEKLFSGTDKPPVVDGTPEPPQLVVRGTQPQIEQIRQLLNNIGEGGRTATASVVNGGKLRMVPMDAETARAVAERIQGIWPNLRSNPIRVIVPSESSSLRTDRPDPSMMEPPRRPPGGMFPGGRRPPRGGERDRLERPDAPDRPVDAVGPYPEADRRPADRPVRTTQYSPDDRLLVPVSYQTPGSDATSEPAAPAPVDESPVDPSESPAAAEAAAIESPAAEVPAAEPPAAELTPAEPAPPAVAPAPDAGPSADQPGGVNAAANAADAEKSPPEIVISPTPQGLMITSDDPEALDTIQSLVQMFASQEAGTQPQFHLFYLKHVEAETARTLITSILTGVTSSSVAATLGSAASSSGNSGRTGVIGSLMQGRPASTPTAAFSSMPHIVADKRLNALFVNGSPEQIALVKQLLEVVDTESGPEEVLTFPRPKFIPVLHMKAETVADVLRQVYANRVESGTNNNNRNQDDQRGRGFPPGFAERFGMMQQGGDGNRQGRTAQQAAGDQPKLTIGVDVESNAVIVSAQGPLLKEVESVVAELDRRALNKPAENIAVVTLKRTNPQLLRETIANLLGDTVEVTQSSAGTASSQSSTNRNRSGNAQGGGGQFPGFGGFGGFGGQGGFGGGFQGRGGFGGAGGFGANNQQGRGGFGGNNQQQGRGGGGNSGRSSGRGGR